MYRKNTAGQHLGFCLVNASNGAALTGATVTAYRSVDGASQAAVTGTVSELGNGQYSLALSQADTNGNQVSFLFTATSAVPIEKTIVTTACDPTSTAFGLSLAKTTNITGFNDIAATAIVSAGAITTSSGAVSSVTTVASVSGSVGSVTGAVGSVTGNVGGNVAGSVGSVTGAVASVTAAVTVGTNNDKTGYALSSAGLDAVTTETGINHRQAQALIMDAVGSVLAGAGTGTVTVKDPSGTHARIVATIDGSNNRTAVTLTPPT